MKRAIEFILYYVPFQLYMWNKKERFITFIQITAILFFQFGFAVYIFLTDYSGIEISRELYNSDKRRNPMSAIVMCVLFIFPLLFYYLRRKSIKTHYLNYIRIPEHIREQKKKIVHSFIWILSPAAFLIEICLINYFFNKLSVDSGQ